MLIAFNKPYGVLCQFRRSDDSPTLADYLSIPEIHPAGRLDKDSEGLLLLTDDGRLQHRISAPGSETKWPKRYLAQVEGVPSVKALEQLRRGIRLNDGPTLPAQVSLLAKPPPWLWPRQPPIRQRQHIPTAWLRIELREGRNRQVRRMTAAVGFPTLRLIREAIGEINVAELGLGEWKKVERFS